MDRITVVISIFLVILTIFSGLYSYRIKFRKHTSHDNEKRGWWADVMQGLSTEFAGALILTILLALLPSILGIEDEIDRRERLYSELESPVSEVAQNALGELRSLGWLTDGSMQGINLSNANLANADLSFVDWERVNLQNANLQAANITSSDLYRANLARANLTNALISNTNMSEANLSSANLTDALIIDSDLALVNFQGAILLGVELLSTSIESGLFNQDTILPDGSNWSETSDLSIYNKMNLIETLYDVLDCVESENIQRSLTLRIDLMRDATEINNFATLRNLASMFINEIQAREDSMIPVECADRLISVTYLLLKTLESN